MIVCRISFHAGIVVPNLMVTIIYPVIKGYTKIYSDTIHNPSFSLLLLSLYVLYVRIHDDFIRVLINIKQCLREKEK